jgi:hypothetical protein
MSNKWKPFTDVERQYLINNYSKIGATHCAKNLERSRHCIQQNAKRLNLKLDRSKICCYVFKKKDVDFNVNPTPFMTNRCITPIHAYLLGFIWADGNISKNGYTISARFIKTDGIDFLPIFQKSGKWNVYKTKPKTKREGKPQYVLYTSNKQLLEYLKSKGYSSKSTQSAVEILDAIPYELQHYWWRGCFDGDGGFYVGKNGYGQITLHSTYDQDWKHIELLCRELNIRYKISKRTKKIKGKISKSSGAQILYGEGIKKLCEYLYPNELEFGLKRKYKKAQKLLSFYKNF